MSYKHRRIYEKYYGAIPIDEYGRTYDIHHIDGNYSNNDPLNLKAVPIAEHYLIHQAQGDIAACLIMSHRMKLPVEIISQLSKDTQRKRVQAGTHNFLGGDIQSKSNQQRIKNGTHHLLGPNQNKKIIEQGKHNFTKREDGSSLSKEIQRQQLNSGTHMNQRFWRCIDCGKEGKGVSNQVQHTKKYCKRKLS